MSDTPNPATTPSGWFVTGQHEDTVVGDNGQVQTGVTVSFRTGNGTNASVFVPNARYNAETVQTMIAARAAELDRVAALTGESAPGSAG